MQAQAAGREGQSGQTRPEDGASAPAPALASATRRTSLTWLGSLWLRRSLPWVGMTPALATAMPSLFPWQSLPDGTRFTTGPDTRLTVVHSDTAREIWLHQGRVQVCSGRAALPWVVCAGQRRLWPLAADYVVHRTPTQLTLRVQAGSVAVQSPATALTVAAGQSRCWREQGNSADGMPSPAGTSAARWAFDGVALPALL